MRRKSVTGKIPCGLSVIYMAHNHLSHCIRGLYSLDSERHPPSFDTHFEQVTKRRKNVRILRKSSRGGSPATDVACTEQTNTEHKDYSNRNSDTCRLIYIYIYGRIWIQEDNWASKGVRKWSQIANINHRPTSKYWLNKLPNWNEALAFACQMTVQCQNKQTCRGEHPRVVNNRG